MPAPACRANNAFTRMPQAAFAVPETMDIEVQIFGLLDSRQ